MIPLALITGFLGSGKTTLLKRLMNRYAERRLFYVVNEFSEANIDGRLVEASVDAHRLEVLPGGSIFCACLVTEFIRVLTSVQEKLASVEGVVIEASGMANPLSVEKLIRETRLDGRFALASVVAIVDPKTLPVLVHTLPAINDQLRAADVVLLNKVDLATSEELRRTTEELARIRPDIVAHHVQHCDIDLDVFAPHEMKGFDTEYAPCVDPHFARFTLELSRPVDIRALCDALTHFGSALYRAKGFVRDGRGEMCHIDLASGRLTVHSADYQGTGVLALILAASAIPRSHNLLHALRCCMLTP